MRNEKLKLPSLNHKPVECDAEVLNALIESMGEHLKVNVEVLLGHDSPIFPEYEYTRPEDSEKVPS